MVQSLRHAFGLFRFEHAPLRKKVSLLVGVYIRGLTAFRCAVRLKAEYVYNF
jgi:hypothetical protein